MTGSKRPYVKRRLGLLVILVVVGGIAALGRQRFGFRIAMQNDPPHTEVVVARWRYTAMGKFRGTGWSHNYPTSDAHFVQVLSEATVINVTGASYKIVDLGSPEVFQYPFAVVSEPGELALTDQEIVNLREYIDRGGFVLLDDFDGQYDLNVIKRTLHRAFPDRELELMTIDHEIFHNFFDIDALNVTSPYLVEGEPIFYGLNNAAGTLGLMACFNNDLENFWDYIDDGRYPLKPSIEAFRLGINFILYDMTH